MYKSAIILSLYLLFSCNDVKVKDASINSLSNSDSLPENENRTDTVLNKEEFDFLLNLNEPDLRNYSKEAFRLQLYRFPRVSHFLFRIEKDSLNNVRLISKEFTIQNPVSGEGVDSVLSERIFELSFKQWKEIILASEQAYFWSMERNECNWSDDIILDGSHWILEVKRLNQIRKQRENICKDYSLVERDNPPQGSFYDLGVLIATLSGQIKIDQIY